MKKFIIILFLISQGVYGGILGSTEIRGKIVKYDSKTVTLSLSNNRKITIPKKQLKKSSKLRTGQYVTAVFDSEYIMNQLKQ